MGLRRLRDQRLDLRTPRRGDVGDGRARHRDALPHGARSSTFRGALERGDVIVGGRRRAASSGSSPRCCASTTSSRRRPASGRARRRPSTALSPARSRPVRSCCCATRPVDGAPVLPLDPGAERSRCSAASPTRSTSATAGRATCGISSAAPSSTACAPPSQASSHDDGERRRRAPRRSPPAPTSPWSSSATPTSTRASTSAQADRRPRRAHSRRADEPEVVDALRSDGSPRSRRRRSRRIDARRATGFGIGRRPRRRSACPTADVALIRAVAAANPRTVVVIQAGSAVVVSEWVDAVPAVVQSWYGGARLGPASPTSCSARSTRRPDCPSAFPSTRPTSGLRPRRHVVPLRPLARLVASRPDGRGAAFPFGFGLSYTTFALEDVNVALDRGRDQIEGAVANTGDRDGADVVQVYDELPDPERPGTARRLRRVEVAAGARNRSASSSPSAASNAGTQRPTPGCPLRDATASSSAGAPSTRTAITSISTSDHSRWTPHPGGHGRLSCVRFTTGEWSLDPQIVAGTHGCGRHAAGRVWGRRRHGRHHDDIGEHHHDFGCCEPDRGQHVLAGERREL